MQLFVNEKSVVRKIWGKSDTVLFIFAGASAEFALNKAVDWLYFTGKLPSDPLGRLFSTVSYARKIVFAPMDDAHKTIDSLTHIHAAVEKARGFSIPDWAYRDVLYMLMHYSITSYELLEKKLTEEEKEEVVDKEEVSAIDTPVEEEIPTTPDENMDEETTQIPEKNKTEITDEKLEIKTRVGLAVFAIKNGFSE